MGTGRDPASTAAARLPFYYGWVNVFAAAVAMTATLPGRTHGLGLITEPLLADLRLDRAAYAHINLGSSLLGAAFCLPVGSLIDRWGVRSVLFGVSAGLGFAVWGMSAVSSPAGLFVTLLLVRGLGQSALSVVSMALIGKWFRRRAGLAMGVFAVLLTFGFVGTVVGVGMAVPAWGWRETWFGIALSLLGFAPLGWLVVRSTPESCGLAIDGDPPGPNAEVDGAHPPASGTQPQRSQASDAAAPDERPPQADFSWGEALATPMFWTFALGTSAFNLVWSAVTLFNESILAERGFDQDAAVRVMSILTGSGLVANLVAGALATTERLGKLLGFGLLVLAAALALLPGLTTPGQLDLYALALGLTGGIVTVVFFAAWGQVYGRRELGRIQGVAQLCSVLASALGPVLAAECQARTGSYSSMFYGLAAVVSGLALAAMLVRLPSRAAGDAASRPAAAASEISKPRA